MKLTITIECDNAAFDDNANDEAARILGQLVERLESSDFRDFSDLPYTLRDINGNSVGECRVSHSEGRQ